MKNTFAKNIINLFLPDHIIFCFVFSFQVITACAILHNICLRVGDIMALEDEHEEDDAEDEGEHVLETVSGAPWHDQLSAEVSALEEVPIDHDYL